MYVINNKDYFYESPQMCKLLAARARFPRYEVIPSSAGFEIPTLYNIET